MNITFIQIIVGISYFISLFLIIYWMIYFIEKKNSIMDEKDKVKPILKTFPFTTIVIPAYNGEHHVIKTLNSVAKLEYPQDRFEILVVNDGSTDRTEHMVRKFMTAYDKKYHGKEHISIRLINQPRNMGKAEALNAGMTRAKGEYFACIDADSTVDSDALLYMMDMFQNDPMLAIATPVMKVDNPETWLQKFQRLEYMSSMLIIKLMGYMNANYVAPGPFSVYKVSVLKKLGKFDGKYNIEDQEIAWRAQKHHYKIRQCASAFVYTVAPRNLKSFTRQRTRWFRGSILTMYSYKDMTFNKKYGDFGLFQIPLMITSYVLSVVALFLFGYYIIKPFIQQMYNWFLINFDLLTGLKHWKFTFNILDVQLMQVLIIYLVLLINIILLYYSSRSSNDRVRQYGALYIIPYFFLYYVLLGIILIKSLFEITIHRKQKW
jgi:cellulose synthase/poly-beta-1,6-N-acetylglucosamine synthase-like glycosyltransferase